MSLGTVIVKPRPTTKEPGTLKVKDVGQNGYGVNVGDLMTFPDPAPEFIVNDGSEVSFIFEHKSECTIVKVWQPGE